MSHYKTKKEVIDEGCELMYDLINRFYTQFPDMPKEVGAAHINTLFIRLTKDLYFHSQKSVNQRWED